MAKFPADAPKREVIRAFERLGFRIVREREHISMVRENADGTRTPLTKAEYEGRGTNVMTTKNVAVIGFKLIMLGCLLSVCFVLGAAVAGMTEVESVQAPATEVTTPAAAPTAPASPDAARFFPVLFAVSLLQASVLAFVILRSRWAGWKLVGGVFLSFWGVNTVLGAIEAAVYLPTQLPAGMVPRIFAMGTFSAALFSPLAVLILGKLRRSHDSEPSYSRLVMSPRQWVWKAAAVAAVYLIVYYTFGYFVAWKNPVVQQYYGGTDPGGFFKQIASVWAATPWMFPFQAFRGLLFMAFALPVVRMLKGRPWEAALAVALLFSILGGAQLVLPNPFMPEAVAKTHLVEVTSSNFLFGWIVGWLLGRRHAAVGDLFGPAEG